MKKPLVFSFVKEQKIFMTLLMSLLTFLSVLCLGLVVALGTAVLRWNQQWDLMATVQVLPGGDAAAVQKVLDSMRPAIAESRQISESDAARLLRPWLKDSDVLMRYIPKMTEVKFKTGGDVGLASKAIGAVPGARFVRHTDGMRAATGAGWKVIFLSVLVLALVLGAIVACVSYITRNITLIHGRELEILNQIGARDSFVARQLMAVIAQISAAAALVGFAAAAPALILVTSIAHSIKVGMFTQMDISPAGWALLFGLAAGIVALSIMTARRTVIRILRKE